MKLTSLCHPERSPAESKNLVRRHRYSERNIENEGGSFFVKRTAIRKTQDECGIGVVAVKTISGLAVLTEAIHAA